MTVKFVYFLFGISNEERVGENKIKTIMRNHEKGKGKGCLQHGEEENE